MSQEFHISPDVLAILPKGDKQKITVAILYFYGRYEQQLNEPHDVSLDIENVDLNDPLSVLKTSWRIHQQVYGDSDNHIESNIIETMIHHPKRSILFSELTDSEIRYTCRVLQHTFDEQEYVAWTENGSYFTDGSSIEESAFNVAAEMMSYTYRDLKIYWFDSVSGLLQRPLLNAIFTETMGKN